MNTKVIASFSIPLLTLGLVKCGSADVARAPAPVPAQTGTVTNAISDSGHGRFRLPDGNCLVPNGANPAPGSVLLQGSCDSPQASMFKLGPSRDVLAAGAHGPIVVGNTLCLDADFETNRVLVNPCNQTASQEWTWSLGKVEPASQTSLCLNATGSSGVVSMANCTAQNTAQTFLPLDFNLMFVNGIAASSQYNGPHPPYAPNSVPPWVTSNTQCLDVQLDFEWVPGDTIDNFQCNETTAQWFHFDSSSHLLTTLGTCVTATSGFPGAAVQVQNCGGANQQWDYTGTQLVQHGSAPARCIDVQNQSNTTGIATVVNTCNAAPRGQVWYANLVWPQTHLVTGVNPPTTTYTTSETSVNVSVVQGNKIITVASNQIFNDNVRPSWIGWSTWDSASKTWSHQDVTLPPEWFPITDNGLASDPAAQQYVYLGFLAEHTTNNNAGGLCVMKSMDGGKTFSPWGCTEAAADGVSMAAFAGHVYFGVWNEGDNTTDIYTNTSDPTTSSTTLRQLPGTPFPGKKIWTHPRLRVTQSGGLYVAAVTGDGELLLNVFDISTQQWGATPLSVTTGVVGQDVFLNGNDQSLTMGNGQDFGRLAAEFSFDVGYGDQTGVSQVRIAYTKRVSDASDPRGYRYYIAAARCFDALDPPNKCVELWTSSGPGDRMRPLIGTSGGFLQHNTWVLTYASRQDDPTGGTASLWGTNLVESGVFFGPTEIVPSETVCSGGMNWGDYDNMTYLSTDVNGVAHFIRPFTDSTTATLTNTCNVNAIMSVSAVVL